MLLSACKPSVDKQAGELLKSMSLDMKLGQMLMIGIPGNRISKKASRLITKHSPGGIILFGYNIKNAPEMRQYINDLQLLSVKSSGIPLFTAIDQEGGRVKRITEGVTQFPGNMAFGVVNDRERTYKAGRILGIQLREWGINMNLAPVLDVNNNARNPVINTRSFGASVPIVALLGKEYIRGLQKSFCVAVGKHFPGHGDTAKDSHKTLPVIPFTRERLERIELVPFKKAVKSGVACIMTAHIAYPAVLGNDEPATHSAFFLSDILRRDIGFKGIVISDDLEMDAISKRMDLGEAAVKTVIAGSDIVLLSTHGKNVTLIMDALRKAVRDGAISSDRIDRSVKRILEAKLRYRIMTVRENRVEICDPSYGDSAHKLLEEAESINRHVSRNAVCFSGRGRFNDRRSWDVYSSVILVSADPGMRELAAEVLNDKNAKICSMPPTDIRKISGHKGNKKILVYYHIDTVTGVQLDFLRRICGREGVEIIAVSTGNPYPLLTADPRPSVLFSLSSTRESRRQLLECIKGEFSPRRDYKEIIGVE